MLSIRSFNHRKLLLPLMALLLLVVSGLLAHSARAQGGTAALGLGRELAQVVALSGNQNRIWINGEQMYQGSANTNLSVKQVLDLFERACGSADVGFAEVWERIPGDRQQELTRKIPDAVPGTLITRHENNGEGALACLVAPRSGSRESFFSRFDGLLESGDLGELGDLRYVYVKPTENGSFVLALWTHGSFRLGTLFGDGSPKSDAPGTDSKLAPRPPNSTRILSAGVGGRPYAARIYVSREAPDQLFAFYREQMSSAGFSEVVGVAASQPGALAFMRDQQSVLLVAEPDPSGTNTTKVGLLESSFSQVGSGPASLMPTEGDQSHE